MQVAIMKRHRQWQRDHTIDHINTCGCDNRKTNLRLATSNKQGANRGLLSSNTSGIAGVYWHTRDSKWYVYMRINGRKKFLGYFINKKDAIATRQQAEIKYFGEFRHDPTNVCPLGYTGQCPECAARLKGPQDV